MLQAGEVATAITLGLPAVLAVGVGVRALLTHDHVAGHAGALRR